MPWHFLVAAMIPLPAGGADTGRPANSSHTMATNTAATVQQHMRSRSHGLQPPAATSGRQQMVWQSGSSMPHSTAQYTAQHCTWLYGCVAGDITVSPSPHPAADVATTTLHKELVAKAGCTGRFVGVDRSQAYQLLKRAHDAGLIEPVAGTIVRSEVNRTWRRTGNGALSGGGLGFWRKMLVGWGVSKMPMSVPPPSSTSLPAIATHERLSSPAPLPAPQPTASPS